MNSTTSSNGRAQASRLAEARRRGFWLSISRSDPVESAYWSWCKRHRQPLVVVTIHRKTASGLLDFDPTEYLSPNPRIGLVGTTLTEAGARIVREWFDRCPAPRVQLLWSGVGSVNVLLTGVPVADAEALGVMLNAASHDDGAKLPGSARRLRDDVHWP